MNMNIYALAGGLVGGFIGICMLSWLIEWALLKRVLDDPVKGKVGSVVAAFVLAVVIYTLNEGNFVRAMVMYGVPTPFIAAWQYRAGVRARDHDIDGLEETFR